MDDDYIKLMLPELGTGDEGERLIVRRPDAAVPENFFGELFMQLVHLARAGGVPGVTVVDVPGDSGAEEEDSLHEQDDIDAGSRLH